MFATVADTASHLVSTGRARRLLRPAGVAAAAGAALWVLAVIDPNEPGHYPTCPWLALTGTYCPGCGSLRALHALTHGDVATALARNPMAVAASAWLVVWFGWWSWRQWTGRARTTMASPWILRAVAAAVAAFWVLRNLPGFSVLGPG